MLTTLSFLLFTQPALPEIVPIFSEPGRGEIEFVAQCKMDSESCTFGRVRFNDDGSVDALVAHTLMLDTEPLSDWVAAGVFWPGPWGCSSAQVLDARIAVYDEGGGEIAEHSGLSVNATGGDRCEFHMPSAIEYALTSRDARSVEMRFALRSQNIPGQRVHELNAREHVRSRFILQASRDKPVNLDSPEFGDKVFRGVYYGGLQADIAPEEARSLPIVMTEYASWADFANSYRRAEERLIGGPESPQGEALSPSVALLEGVVAELNQGLAYRVTRADLGLLPKRPFHEVIESGFGDCKSLSLALLGTLRRMGVDSATVITSTRSRVPSSVLVPDFRWADHAVVHVPALDVYVDMTAPIGSQIIDASSQLYGTLGIHTGTGDFVVIR